MKQQLNGPLGPGPAIAGSTTTTTTTTAIGTTKIKDSAASQRATAKRKAREARRPVHVYSAADPSVVMIFPASNVRNAKALLSFLNSSTHDAAPTADNDHDDGRDLTSVTARLPPLLMCDAYAASLLHEATAASVRVSEVPRDSAAGAHRCCCALAAAARNNTGTAAIVAEPSLLCCGRAHVDPTEAETHRVHRRAAVDASAAATRAATPWSAGMWGPWPSLDAVPYARFAPCDVPVEMLVDGPDTINHMSQVTSSSQSPSRVDGAAAMSDIVKTSPSGCIALGLPNDPDTRRVVPVAACLKTRALQSGRRPLSVCAHWLSKGLCSLGDDCLFVHVLDEFVAASSPPNAPTTPSFHRSSAINDVKLHPRTSSAVPPLVLSNSDDASLVQLPTVAEDGAPHPHVGTPTRHDKDFKTASSENLPAFSSRVGRLDRRGLPSRNGLGSSSVFLAQSDALSSSDSRPPTPPLASAHPPHSDRRAAAQRGASGDHAPASGSPALCYSLHSPSRRRVPLTSVPAFPVGAAAGQGFASATPRWRHDPYAAWWCV